jgi:hypothetical protein
VWRFAHKDLRGTLLEPEVADGVVELNRNA